MKTLTYEQVLSRKEKAERFVEDVLEDPERADEIAAESVESYGERRGFSITNPRRIMRKTMTKQELEDRVEELEQQLDDVFDLVAGDEVDDDEEEDSEEGSEEEGSEDDEYEAAA